MFEQLLRLLAKKISREHYPGVPDPSTDVEALFRTVQALKVGYEQLVRGRGSVGKSALLVEELDAFAEAFIPVLDARYNAVIGEGTGGFEEHIADTDIHFPDAPPEGPWGREEGAWLKLPEQLPVDWMDVIDDNAVVHNKGWSSQYLNALLTDILNQLNLHIADTNNPHVVTHSQLSDTSDPDSHPISAITGLDYALDTRGFIAQMPAGEALALGDLCYLDSAGKMSKCDATLPATSSTLMGVADAAAVLDEVIKFILKGFVDSTGRTGGDILYASTTPGAVVSVAPSGSGEVVRVLGYALAADQYFFDPDKTWIELA